MLALHQLPLNCFSMSLNRGMAWLSLTDHSLCAHALHLVLPIQGLAQVMSSMPEKLATGLETARQAGLDPSRMYAKLMGNQNLAKHLQDPRVLAALMDVCRWDWKAWERRS